MRNIARQTVLLALLGAGLSLTGCTTVYYDSPVTEVVVVAPPPPPPHPYPHPDPCPVPTPVPVPAPTHQEPVVIERTKPTTSRGAPNVTKDRDAGRDRKTHQRR